jgi:excisionase family DNA binding protein
MADDLDKRLLTVKQVCNYLSVSHTTVYRMIERKELSPITIGGRTLFDKKDIDNLIETARTAEAPPQRRGRRRKGT